ncbi:MAG: MBOAT family protein [Fuerstiella sp.]|nr:MBOAT family protein [Fuerstiella sp.]
MLFNSLEFAVFLPIVLTLFWWRPIRCDLKRQNVFVSAASYLFYGWWDYRFLTLILFSTLVDYLVGRELGKTNVPGRRKALLWTSIVVNLGFLGFFKYCNFFADSFVSAFTFFGAQISSSSLSIVLPVGISFYTLQTLSYTIDVYRRRLGPTHDFFAFAAFVSFFPQLVAGPVERATNLLPQFTRSRIFDYTTATDGLRQILWGMFTKVVIADNCAACANAVFNNSESYGGTTLIAGVIFFSFQVYGDFSGYSNIAIGTAKLFGFDLMRNFAYPYFSRDIAEFWRRWHISLSTWFRDYLYIPLGGSRRGSWVSVRNVFVVFLVSGLWHGANWTFVVWGALNAVFFLPLLLLKRNRNYTDTVASGRSVPSWRELSAMATTFSLTTFAWIFFRAESVGHAAGYIRNIFSASLFAWPEVFPADVVCLVALFVATEWHGRHQSYAIAGFGIRWPRVARWALYYGICIAIVAIGGEQQDFIYFQF